MFRLFCEQPKNSSNGNEADTSNSRGSQKVLRGLSNALSKFLNTTNGNSKQGHVESKGSQTEELTTERLQLATKEAAKLLFDIKDVRDELNIINTVAKYQRKVQSAMTRDTNDNTCASCQMSKDSDENLTADYVCNDIEELDKVAFQIQDSVSRL